MLANLEQKKDLLTYMHFYIFKYPDELYYMSILRSIYNDT